MKQYTIEQFEKKYLGKRHVTAAVHYNGTFVTFMNLGASQIISFAKNVVNFEKIVSK